MLGLKIAATGALVLLVASCVARGRPWPGVAIAVPLLLAWFGGAFAIVAGLLMAVWA